MREVIAYQCDHCPKYYKHKHNAKRHENSCFFNPETKSCASCAHFIDWKDSFEDGRGQMVSESGYYCDHLKSDFEHREDGKLDLKTNCEHWRGHDLSNE